MAEDAIAFQGLRIRERIRWIAFHKQLRGQTVLAGNRSPAMHVARTAGVDGGLDGAEQIFPVGSVQELADPLEVRVTISDGAVCVDVSAVVVCLPDFYQCAANRAARAIEHPARHPGDFSNRGGCAVVDDEQIVVQIERQLIGVEGAFKK